MRTHCVAGDVDACRRIDGRNAGTTVKRISSAVPQHTYTTAFYEQQSDGSIRSARRVLPHLLEIVSPKSIVDVGCGVGTWLAAARELGIDDVLGVDGPYVDRRMLQIPDERFQVADLTQPLNIGRTFDLALCLEVGEHLPTQAADQLVATLTRVASVVLFSAAIPRQGGENHINEQWQSWWVERFRGHGYLAIDCIRPRIWNDHDVEWWYAQNILLMVREDTLRSSPALSAEFERSTGTYSLVHPRAYLNRLNAADTLKPRGLREWVAAGPSLVAATLRRLISRR
jgi:2-polyprenyl-3-methyl-5-hydroxy-6-metoxy-1,4-benzoquinol methylase